MYTKEAQIKFDDNKKTKARNYTLETINKKIYIFKFKSLTLLEI